MNNYKICVYAICKNEEKFVDRWMDSMSEADLIVVTDTGSTDDTVKKLRQRGAVVYADRIDPWRFDVARNVSLEHVPDDVDICVCTDLDEIFEKGWRQCLERSWTPEAKSGKYLYNWSLKEDGTPYVQLYYSKVHARLGFCWKYPVHEWLSYFGSEPFVTVSIDGMVLNHYPDDAKSRGSYLPLLELAEVPSMRDAYIECAQMAYEIEDWATVFFMVEQALKINEKSRVYVNAGYAWDHTPYDLGALGCYYLEMYERSLQYEKAALNMNPEDARLQNNLRLIESKCQEIQN